MTIDRKEFLKALKEAMPGIDSGNVVLEGADTFIFNNGFIHSFNDNISVSIPFEIKNKNNELVNGNLKGKDLYDLLNRYHGDKIKLIPKNDIWIFQSENARAELTLLNNNISEQIANLIDKKMKWQTLPSNFIEAISICQFSKNKSVLAGIFINDNIVNSTDEIRINWYEMKESINGTFWLSDNAIKELIKLTNPKEYCISDSWVHFRTENKTIFSCKRLTDDKYPIDKMRDLVESHKKEKNDLSNKLPEALMDAVNRAAALSQNIDNFDTIRLTFNKDFIEVFSQRTSGKYTENVALEKPFKNDFEPISIYVDYAMIENGLKYSKSFYLKKVSFKKREEVRIIFTNPNGIQLIKTFEGDK